MKSRITAAVFTTIFFLFLALPGIGALTGWGRQSDEDIRWSELRGRRSFSLASPRDFNRWLEDNLGWRGEFFRLHERLIHGLFGQSPREGRVQVGQNGFLFLGDDFQQVFSRHAGTGAIGRRDLEQAAEDYEALATALERIGIPSVLVIAPDKATIYPEHLPVWVRQPAPALPQEWGSLLSRGAIFLAPALLRAKEEWAPREIYLRDDTHWNHLGAYSAYREIMAALERILERRLSKLEARSPKPVIYEALNPDLARFMSIKAPYSTYQLDFVPRLYTDCAETPWPDKESSNRMVQCPSALNNLELLFIHDSFLWVNRAIYDSSFNRVITIHIESLSDMAQATQAAAMLREGQARPDIAVIMLVERTVVASAPKVANFARLLESAPAERQDATGAAGSPANLAANAGRHAGD